MRLTGAMLSAMLAATACGLHAEPTLPAAEYALYSALLNHGLDPGGNAIGAPSRTKMKHAAANANFF